MRERIKNICQWHILILVVGIFLFSALCWMGFIKSFGSEIISCLKKHSDVVNEENIDAKDLNKDSNMQYLELLDQTINTIDMVWYEKIFRKTRTKICNCNIG